MADDRTAAAYDALAEAYALHVAGELDGKPFDRAFLDELAARLQGAGPVLDLGCGPGHVAAYLAARGLAMQGLDLSPRMVAVARERHPALSFEVGDLRRLAAGGPRYAGIVAFYAIVHLQPAELATAFGQMHGALQAGGLLALGFHIGDEVRHVDELWGVRAALDFVFFDPDAVCRALAEAGFVVERRHEREPYPAPVEAQTRRCYLVARREPVADGSPMARPMAPRSDA
jgi:SAM-dependent methyltransferase